MAAVEPDRAELTHVTNHVTAGLAMFTSSVRGRTVINGLLTSWLNRVQEIEDATWDVFGAFDLSTAVGDQLDKLGRLVGLARGSLSSDSLYRVALAGWIRANRSNGNLTDLHAVATILYGDGAYSLDEYNFAAIVVVPDAPSEIGSDMALVVMRRARAAGIGMQVIAPAPSGTGFRFSASAETSETSADHGFSNTTQTTGGHLAGVQV